VERSSDQVIKPVNVGALKKWVGQVPKDVEEDLAEIAPMMKVFGYDPSDRDPNYGEPEPQVAKNTV
jgi:protein-tyrosine sulfotransferase